MIEWILAILLLFASALMTYGCWLISHPAGFIVGGFLLAAISVLYLLETS
jgi:hypothetical protein